MPGPFETRKDLVQEAVESGATHVGRIATIVTGAVRDVARELGSFATDVFEMREASDRALKDHELERELDSARTAELAAEPGRDREDEAV
jgi:transposase-like protein